MKKLFIIALGSVFVLYGTPVLAEDPDDDDDEEEEDNDDDDDEEGEEEEEDDDDDDDDDNGEEEEEEEEEGLVAEACNRTKNDIWVAYAAEQGDGDYASKGWYQVRPGKCEELDTGLEGTIYMVAMEGKKLGKGEIWLPREDGDTRSFCVDKSVKSDEFTYEDRKCKKQDKNAVKQEFGRVFDKDDDGVATFTVR